MTKTCKDCFHNTVCAKTNREGHDDVETCDWYVYEEDVIIESLVGEFKYLTDEVFKLFTSFKQSGFSEEAALILTKEYMDVAFEHNAVRLQEKRTRDLRKSLLKERR